jgi:hypothetical protein
MEFADILTSKARRGTASPVSIDPDGAGPATPVAASPGNISSGAYPLSRYLWHVTWKQDMIDGNSGTGGPAGASAALRYWLCKNGNSRHGTNFNTGNNVNVDITNAITTAGYVRLPVAEGQVNGITGETERCRIDYTP